MSLTLRHHSFDERIAAARQVGVNEVLIALLWRGGSGVRYGEAGRQFAEVADLEAALVDKAINLPPAVIAAAHALAVALDLDDVYFSSSIIPAALTSPSGTAWSVQLSVMAYQRTAVRTGIYLPGRTQLMRKGTSPADWEATATGWVRSTEGPGWLAALDGPGDWAEVGVQTSYAREIAKPGADVESWERSPAARLPVAASVQVIERALGPLAANLATELS